MRNIRVVPYDPAWPAAFEQEATWLAELLSDDLLAIHHIGSTAVPGLPAKPVIDILPVVRDIARVELFSGTLIEAGYTAWGEHGIPGRRVFTKGGEDHRTHNVHIFETGDPNIARHVNFRDYLRAHPAEAQHYAVLKAALAQQFPNDITAYNKGKEPFILEMQRKATEWSLAQATGGSIGPGA